MSEDKWYYDTATGQVTQGKESSWDTRMGPYDTQEEAAHAMERAQQRNREAEEWDEED